MADATKQIPENQEQTGTKAPDTKAAANNQPETPSQQTPETQGEFVGITRRGETPPPSAPAVAAPTTDAPATDAPAAQTPAAPQNPQAPKQPAPETDEDKPAFKAPAQEEEEPLLPKSKFMGQGDYAQLLESWKIKNLPEEMEEALLNGGIKRKMNGFEFTLQDGSKFGWSVDSDGREFIGTTSLFGRMTPEMAAAQVATAKAHGWNEIDIHGSYGRKEMLWLAAMRAGLTVNNFEPDADSEVLRKWEKEKQAMSVDITRAETPDAPKAEAKADAPAAEAPAAPAAETPAAPAATAPATDAPAAPAAETPAATAPVAQAPAAEAPKAEAPQAEAPQTEAPTTQTAAAEAPATAAPASKFGAVTTEAPAAQAPAAEAPKAEGPKTEQPKAETPKPEEQKPEAPKADAPKADAPKNDTVQDPAHRAGIEKLKQAIDSGKLKVDGPLEKEIVNGIESPKGFNKAIEYFSNKTGTDLGIPKVAVPAAADAGAPRQQTPKAKGTQP